MSKLSELTFEPTPVEALSDDFSGRSPDQLVRAVQGLLRQAVLHLRYAVEDLSDAATVARLAELAAEAETSSAVTR